MLHVLADVAEATDGAEVPGERQHVSPPTVLLEDCFEGGDVGVDEDVLPSRGPFASNVLGVDWSRLVRNSGGRKLGK